MYMFVNIRNGYIMPKIKFIIRQYVKMILQYIVLPLYYNIHKPKKIDERLVIFADAHNHTIPYSMKNMHDKYKERGYRVLDIFSDYGKDSFLVTAKKMLFFTKNYSKAKYVFICDYFLPVAAPKKRTETKVVQLWHACGIFKKFGYDAEDDIPKIYKGRAIKNIDLVTVSSEECVPVYAKAMRLPNEIVIPTGVSRTDDFFNDNYIQQCKKEFYDKYPEAIDKKIALWAPTFRGNAALPHLEGASDIVKLKDELKGDWFIVIRVHPHFNDIDINCSIPTERLIPVIDLLISDYSTVIFEYALFCKPLILFAPDYETYGSKRGFYIDYESIPGRIITDTSLLSQGMEDEYRYFNKAEMQKFKDKYLFGCDGNSTERIFKLVRKL